MFYVIQPDSWGNMRHLVSEMTGEWVFRGQSDADWGLISSLERALGQIDDGDRRDVVESKETLLLSEFKRRAHHYITSPPSDEKNLEWLALVQHHGGATRLLDFSHSFYVAAFFAVENIITEYNNAAIWAINLTQVDKDVGEKLRDKFTEMDATGARSNSDYIRLAQMLLEKGTDRKVVFGVEPERMNERLAVQQGLFLFPCDLGVSFEENLAGVFNETADIFQKRPSNNYNPETFSAGLLSVICEMAVVIKIIVPSYIRVDILHDLWKMNVSSGTLFPGIDGFTRSLNYHLL